MATRLHVDDAARAVVAALDRPSVAAGEMFNIGEAATCSVGAWIEMIMPEVGKTAELVRVPDDALPADLRTTRTHSQHLLVSSHKAMTLLDWQSEAPVTSVARSVRWHLDHPPADEPTVFSADDEALARAV